MFASVAPISYLPGMTDQRSRPVTRDYLERAALFYLERYSSSSENLRRVLLRKARKRLGPEAELGPEIDALVAETIDKVVRTGLVDDTLYADSKVASLMRRGTSTRQMRVKLLAKGVRREAVAQALEGAEPDELALARRFAQRKRLGPWRKGDPAPFRDKDLAALARAGFPYAVARAALETEPEDEG